MVEEQKIEQTNSEDWSEDYKGEREETNSKWFKDTLQKDELSFNANIKFLDEGTKTTNKFNDKVIRFQIETEGETKTMDVKANQYDYLKIIAENKPLTGKTAKHQRTGTTRSDTRRTIKFLEKQ